MSRKIIFITLVFFGFLMYLNQKVNIYVEAYNLQEGLKTYNNLVDTRDDLLYNFSKQTCLENVNFWVEANGYKLLGEEKVLVLNINNPETGLRNKKYNIITSSLNRIFRYSGMTRALAQERR